MKPYIETRVLSLAEYILATNSTVRQAAHTFGISKSTVHKDLSERLRELNPATARRVQRILSHNLEERHIRGGIATRRKYRLLREETRKIQENYKK